MAQTQITRYYVVSESDYTSNPLIPVIDNNRNLIATVSPDFFAAMALEGTGKLDDNRVVNTSGGWAPATQEISQALTKIAQDWYKGRNGYAGLSPSGRYYFTFQLSASNWGVGMRNIPLVPFTTCASDQSIYPLGTVLSIPALTGMSMPDGSIHTGIVNCVDRGSAIVGNHIDLFTGTKKWSNMLILPDYADVEIS